MKTVIIIIIVSFLCSCKEESLDLISYNSEIFSGQDTLIYGEWKYSISYGGITGGPEIFSTSLLSIVPFGEYVAVSKNGEITKGKILIKDQDNGTEIQFCIDGLESKAGRLQSLNFHGPDSLILQEGCCDNFTHYYKRIK